MPGLLAPWLWAWGRRRNLAALPGAADCSHVAGRQSLHPAPSLGHTATGRGPLPGPYLLLDRPHEEGALHHRPLGTFKIPTDRKSVV